MLDPRRLLQRELPTRKKLEKPPTRNRFFLALAIAGTLLTAAARWWATNGATLAHEWINDYRAFQLYWSAASEADKAAWKLIALAFLLGLLLIILLVHRFVWRAFFPDLVRLDAKRHPAGRPERVGRLYRTRAYRDGDHTRYRLYYKHGGRWFPLFRFDFVDLDEPAKPIMYGVSMIRCGRLERDPTGNRFHRIPNSAPFGAHEPQTSFREREVVEDQDRKASIAMPGPGMNPEVMRRKWASEKLRTRWAAEMEDDDIDKELEEALRHAQTRSE